MKKLGPFQVRYHTSLRPDELAVRIDRERGRPDVRLQGSVDERGFRFYRYGGLATRSYLLEFRGVFRATDDGSDVTVRVRPRPLETVIFVAILVIGARFVADPALATIGLVILVGMTALYAVLANAEWRAARRMLERTFDRRT